MVSKATPPHKNAAFTGNNWWIKFCTCREMNAYVTANWYRILGSKKHAGAFGMDHDPPSKDPPHFLSVSSRKFGSGTPRRLDSSKQHQSISYVLKGWGAPSPHFLSGWANKSLNFFGLSPNVKPKFAKRLNTTKIRTFGSPPRWLQRCCLSLSTLSPSC